MAGKVHGGTKMKVPGTKNTNQFGEVNAGNVPNVPTPNIAKAMRGGTIRGKK